MMEQEAKVCATCGREHREEGIDCAPCAHRRGTWKRQMRFYALAMLAGVIVLALAQWLYAGVEGAERSRYLLSALGGLGILGGLFGFGVALFFHLWHRRPEDG